jgi:hypothetical protein
MRVRYAVFGAALAVLAALLAYGPGLALAGLDGWRTCPRHPSRSDPLADWKPSSRSGATRGRGVETWIDGEGDPLATTIAVVGRSSKRPKTEQRAGAPATDTSYARTRGRS